jgi:hypothetical protein
VLRIVLKHLQWCCFIRCSSFSKSLREL